MQKTKTERRAIFKNKTRKLHVNNHLVLDLMAIPKPKCKVYKSAMEIIHENIVQMSDSEEDQDYNENKNVEKMSKYEIIEKRIIIKQAKKSKREGKLK